MSHDNFVKTSLCTQAASCTQNDDGAEASSTEIGLGQYHNRAGKIYFTIIKDSSSLSSYRGTKQDAMGTSVDASPSQHHPDTVGTLGSQHHRDTCSNIESATCYTMLCTINLIICGVLHIFLLPAAVSCYILTAFKAVEVWILYHTKIHLYMLFNMTHSCSVHFGKPVGLIQVTKESTLAASSIYERVKPGGEEEATLASMQLRWVRSLWTSSVTCQVG